MKMTQLSRKYPRGAAKRKEG